MAQRRMQRSQHSAGLVLADEDVHIDIDGAPGALGAEGQRQRAAEGVGEPLAIQGCADHQDLVDNRRHVGRKSGNSKLDAWRAGNCSANSRTAINSSPRDIPSISEGIPRRVASSEYPVAATIRESTVVVGSTRPFS